MERASVKPLKTIPVEFIPIDKEAEDRRAPTPWTEE